jgi:hypothetical protein
VSVKVKVSASNEEELSPGRVAGFRPLGNTYTFTGVKIRPTRVIETLAVEGEETTYIVLVKGPALRKDGTVRAHTEATVIYTDAKSGVYGGYPYPLSALPERIGEVLTGEASLRQHTIKDIQQRLAPSPVST